MLTEKSSEHEKEIEDREQGIEENIVESTHPYNWIGKSFKKLLNWSKDYLTTCILLISGLGAILQIYNLMAIDIRYVRFFSSSQLIPDGALILAITVILVLGYKVGDHVFLNDDMQQTIKKHSKEDRGYVKRCIYAMIPIVGLLVFVVALQILVKPGYIIYVTAGIGFAVPLLMASMLHSFEYNSYIADKEDATGKEKSLATITEVAQVGIGSVMIIFYMLLVITIGFKSYEVPNDLENISKVEERVEQDYGNIEGYKILYFNDKYLFIRLIKENSTTVAIYETNEVMFDKNIIVNQPKQ